MIEKMEKKYGIKVRDDSYWNPFKRKFVKRYKIYTADGCPWENGLSFRGLQAECRKHGDVFIAIAIKEKGKR